MTPAARQTFAISLACAPLALALIALFFLPDADGLVRRGGEAQAYAGADFVNMYEGARAALAGDLGLLYDFARYNEALRSDFPGVPFHSWSYPPHMLLLVAPLGLLPYWAAFAVWQGVGFALLIWSVWPERGAARDFAARACLVAAIALAPASLINFAGGQNGFLSAALFIGGFRLLGPRPLLAGVLFGLLTIKPQFGVVAPFALALIGAWRSFAAAAATTLGLAAVSALVFGAQPWVGMFEVTMPFQIRLVATMEGFYALMMPTTIAAVRLSGFAAPAAAAAHVVVCCMALAACAMLLRRARDWREAALAVAGATPLVAPYYFNYDMVAIAALAAAVSMRGERAPGWRAGLVVSLLFAAPALTMHLAIAGAPFGVALVAAALALMTLRPGPRAVGAPTPAGAAA